MIPLPALGVFLVAAVLEIGGCFAFWAWLRRGASGVVAVAGVISLVAFAVVLTRTDAPFAGRAYAGYGGVYIAASLVWLWLIEGQTPTWTDLAGAALAVIWGGRHRWFCQVGVTHSVGCGPSSRIVNVDVRAWTP